METQKFCQSCAMPLVNPEDFGTESCGGKSEDYCRYCYENGAFRKEESMDEMIETCIPFAIEAGEYKTADEARAAMREFFPKMKRWAAA